MAQKAAVSIRERLKKAPFDHKLVSGWGYPAQWGTAVYLSLAAELSPVAQFGAFTEVVVRQKFRAPLEDAAELVADHFWVAQATIAPYFQPVGMFATIQLCDVLEWLVERQPELKKAPAG